jgi:hypothetical protein
MQLRFVAAAEGDVRLAAAFSRVLEVTHPLTCGNEKIQPRYPWKGQSFG